MTRGSGHYRRMDKLGIAIIGLILWAVRSRSRRPTPAAPPLVPQVKFPTTHSLSEKLAEEVKQFDSLLDFELSKTHQALSDAGKMLGSAALTYFFLIVVVSLLVFGNGVENSIAVPLVGLKLNKDWAAGVTLLLSNGALLWLFASVVTFQMLEFKLGVLLAERYDNILKDERYKQHLLDPQGRISIWHLLPPSPYMAIVNAISIFPRLFRYLFAVIGILFFTAGVYGLASYLAWKIGGRPLLVWTILSLIPAAVAQYTYGISLQRNPTQLNYQKPKPEELNTLSKLTEIRRKGSQHMDHRPVELPPTDKAND